MPARLDDVCQNRLVPNCPARYFLIFRSRCDNGAPRHLGAARLPPAERRPRDVSPRSLARLNQGSGSFSGIPCGFAVLVPARLDDVCQNRLVPNCPARYFLIFRSRCDNGAPRHLGAARLPPAERRPRDVSPRSLARLNQGLVSLTSVSTKSGAEGARTLDILLAKQVL